MFRTPALSILQCDKKTVCEHSALGARKLPRTESMGAESIKNTRIPCGSCGEFAPKSFVKLCSTEQDM